MIMMLVLVHSTDLALLQLFERVSNALADHKHVISIFMDLMLGVHWASASWCQFAPKIM